MSKLKPFVKKIKVGNNYYIYDVNTNSILSLDFLTYSLIACDKSDKDNVANLRKRYNKKEIENAKKVIDTMKARGYLSIHRPNITFFHKIPKQEFPEHLKQILNNRLSRITLVVSEKCNMRCKYCAYSGKYLYNRNHSKKVMDLELFKKAVDFYISHSGSIYEKRVSFYGGEPLINFDVIQKGVEYIKKKYSYPFDYNMTINGTLLNEENIKYLVENNFSILISLDGPKKTHDRYRIFANGRGTFDRIYNNLKLIKYTYPEYYKKKVRFNIVLSPPLNLNDLNQFISQLDIKPSGIRFSDITSHHTTFFKRFSKAQLDEFYSHRIDYLNSFNEKLANNTELNEVEKNLYRTRYASIHKRDMDVLKRNAPSNGQCIFGERSLLINADGSFNFCTQVEDVFNLGNVYDGYNFRKIINLYYDLDKFLGERCHNCWAIRFCMKCIKEFNKNGLLDEESFKNSCSGKKQSILNELIDYIGIRERNYTALNYLNDITIT